MAGGGAAGVAVGTVAAGGILIWSGVRGASVLKTLQALVQGQKPAGLNAYPIGTPKPPSSGDSPSDGSGGNSGGMVDLALSQVGVREGAGNSNKYDRELGWPMGPWCASFICWLAKKTGNSSVIPQTASAPGMAQAFGSRYHTGTGGIQAGDIVFQHGASDGWGGIGHVGIAVGGGMMVAGNYGDKVAKYSYHSAKTVGYARPGYVNQDTLSHA